MIPSLRVSKVFPAVLKKVALLGCGLLMLPAFGQQPLQTLLVGVDRRAWRLCASGCADAAQR